MKKRALILSLAAIFVTSSTSLANELFIDGDLAAAKAEAKKSSKLVMIDFKAEWCGPCKMLDRTTWKDEKVITSVTEKAIAVKIDVDEQRDIASKYSIRSIPTIIFVDADGKEVSRFIGYRDAEGFLKEFGKIGKS